MLKTQECTKYRFSLSLRKKARGSQSRSRMTFHDALRDSASVCIPTPPSEARDFIHCVAVPARSKKTGEDKEVSTFEGCFPSCLNQKLVFISY